MKAIRIVLTQSSANYRREETSTNKMTYPLPPPSTIIGALHNACGYKEYHEMDISIQGKYESMHREPYTDYCFLNSTMDDRGILVKMRNPSMLSTGFEKVAAAKKSKGNSFKNNTTIQVYNEELIEEYRNLKNLKDDIDKFKKERIKKVIELIKKRKKSIASKKKKIDNTSLEYTKLVNREKQIKNLEKNIKEKLKDYEENNYTKKISQYRSLTTSIKYYEILNNVYLVIHVKSDDKTMKDILENGYRIKSIGRSEDFVDIKEIKLVDLFDDDSCEIESKYSAYINYEDIRNEKIISVNNQKNNSEISGTKYYLTKNYDVEKAKKGVREFKRVKSVYTSLYSIEETSENVYIDKEDEKNYIVNFL